MIHKNLFSSFLAQHFVPLERESLIPKETTSFQLGEDKYRKDDELDEFDA